MNTVGSQKLNLLSLSTMSDYIVSARKYRPQTFDTVVGQSPLPSTLRSAIQNDHLAQAFLFCGSRGVGKTTSARILAKTINCEKIEVKKWRRATNVNPVLFQLRRFDEHLRIGCCIQ